MPVSPCTQQTSHFLPVLRLRSFWIRYHVRWESFCNLLITLFQRNNSLKILNLAWNGFSEKGSRAMGEALAKNKCLQELDLSSNRISMDATAFLVKGLQKNEILHTIKVYTVNWSQHKNHLLLLGMEFNTFHVHRTKVSDKETNVRYCVLFLFVLFFVFTDRVRSTREGNVFSLSTPRGRWGTRARSSPGGYPSQVQPGGGLPKPGPAGGVPWSGGLPNGYPTLVTPPVRPGWGTGGYPTLGTPGQPWPGGVRRWGGTPPQVPPIRSGWGVPQLGGGTPPSSTWYATVGMPLAFTQEDFLVCTWVCKKTYGKTGQKSHVIK